MGLRGKSWKSWFGFLPIFLAASLSLACNTPEENHKPESQPRAQVPLRFAQLPISYSAVTHIAESQGLFRREGLNYFPLSVPAGPDVVAALRSGGASGANAGGIAVTPVITMLSAGDHPVVLATTILSGQQVRLLTFSSTGISQNYASLRGKRVGVVRNTVGDIYLSRLLSKASLKESDLIVVNGRPADIRNLLVDGSLDAAILWDPFISQGIRSYQQRNGSAAAPRGEPVVLVEPDLYTLAFNIVAPKSQVDQRREDLKKLLRGAVRAGRYITSNKAEAQTKLEAWLELESGDLSHFMDTTDFRVHLAESRMARWMKEELGWLKSRQPEVQIPQDLSTYIDSSLLREIDPTLVTN